MSIRAGRRATGLLLSDAEVATNGTRTLRSSRMVTTKPQGRARARAKKDHPAGRIGWRISRSSREMVRRATVQKEI